MKKMNKLSSYWFAVSVGLIVFSSMLSICYPNTMSAAVCIIFVLNLAFMSGLNRTKFNRKIKHLLLINFHIRARLKESIIGWIILLTITFGIFSSFKYVLTKQLSHDVSIVAVIFIILISFALAQRFGSIISRWLIKPFKRKKISLANKFV